MSAAVRGVRDWFRIDDWTASTQALFRRKLGKARRPRRAQYLKLAAWHLVETGRRENLDGAVELLETLLRDYPDPLFVGGAHRLLAKVRESRADVDGALEQLRCAIRFAHPNMHSGAAELDFGWLALRHERKDCYREAVEAMDRAGNPSSPFPVERYRAAALRAIEAAASGRGEEARRHARDALDAAASRSSDVGARHRGLGLVPSGYLASSIHRDILRLGSC